MLEVKKITKKLLDEVDNDIKIHRYSSAIKRIVGIYEYAFKELYKNYLGQVNNPIVFIEKMNEYNVKMFGTWLRFIAKTTFLEEIHHLIHSTSFKDKEILLKHLNEINNIRISETHIEGDSSFNSTSISKEIVKEAQNHIYKFLKKFDLYDTNHFSFVNNFNQVNIQKLNGEIQFYESLYEVLSEEDITHLDVTYFSNKIPKTSNDKIVNAYWSMVNKRVQGNDLKLRRIVTIDENDRKGKKLLWILFNMIPKLYNSLNKNVFINLFKTSSTFIECNDSYVDLLNLILMYNKKNPDQGHIWIFSGHSLITQEHEYIHIYGSENLIIFQKLYNNLFDSAIPLNNETITNLLNLRSKSYNKDNINELIDKVHAIKEEIELKSEDFQKIKEVYQLILNGEIHEEYIW